MKIVASASHPSRFKKNPHLDSRQRLPAELQRIAMVLPFQPRLLRVPPASLRPAGCVRYIPESLLPYLAHRR
jgi:hypothetical protein